MIKPKLICVKLINPNNNNFLIEPTMITHIIDIRINVRRRDGLTFLVL